MKSLLKAGCMAVLALAAPAVHALAVGNLRVSSLQGAPLEAEVDVLASLDEIDAAWTVELLEDPSGESPLEPEVFASLGGTVQRAPDGSLFVLVSSAEPIPAPAVSFRLRLVSQRAAVVARMSGTLLPLPKPPPMAQRPSRARSAGQGPVAITQSVAVPTIPAAEAVAASRAVETMPASTQAAVTDAVPAGVATTPNEAREAQPQGLQAPEEAAPAQLDGEAAAPPAPQSMPVEAIPAAAPPGQPEAGAATPGSEATQVSAPAPGAATAGAETPAASIAATEPQIAEPAAPEGSWMDLIGFSVTQALAIATGLAVLVVLLVMRRRLAVLVMSRLSALRDETLKAQVANKLQAQAAEKAQAASARDAPRAPAPRAEADLNAEIDVLLAYAEYGKADERLQAALREAPNNIQARLRLAELRYITEDSAGFVELVEQIQARHRSELTDEQWQKLTRMGKIVAPDAALFAGPRVVQRDAS